MKIAPSTHALNVLGTPLQPCCHQPLTGFYRDGFCHTDERDVGSHTVCVVVTQEFLELSRSLGNDLITPRPELNFPGLKPGDQWCLCASRWAEAFEAGVAPRVILEACEERALEDVSLADLRSHVLQ